MKVNQRTLLACAVSSVLGISTSAAWAQEGGRSTSVLEEIIVTAQKRSQGLQDVPVAVSAFTSETRDLLGVTTIGDLTDFTPGLSYVTTLDRMSLRGVGRLTNNYGSDPGIATYSDGFYTASNVEAGKRPMFTERIEVLRGPQGTLYGRNSIGGALNVISKRPTDTWQGEVRAVAGNYDTQIFDGSISGPISDWLRFKVAGSSGGQGVGFFRDVSDGLTEGNVGDDLYVEGQLEFNVGENFEGWFKYAHSEWNQKRRSIVQITPDDVAPVYFGGLFPNTTFNASTTPPTVFNGAQPPVLFLSGDRFVPTSPSLADPRSFDVDTPFHTELDNVHIYTLELIWHTGFADVKYVGGYQGYTYQQFSDFDTVSRGPYTVRVGGIPNPAVPGTFFPGPGQPTVFTIQPNVEAFYLEDKEYYSNEINLISNSEGPFQWILGLYQYHEQVFQPSGVRVPLQAQLTQPNLSATSTQLGPANPNRDLQNAGAYLDADARAVFAQIDYDFTDHWKMTLGARYTEDNKDADEFRTRVLYGFASRIPAGTPGAGFWVGIPFAFYSEINRQNHLSGDWHATTGTAGLEWTPTTDTLAFAKYTRGYKSGGFNAGQFAGLEGYTDPEFINSYELGLKQTIAERLTANLSIFYYDYKDAQYPSTVRDPVSNINESRFFNLEKATSMGVELEANWAVTDALNLILSYSYLDTEIKDDRCFIDNADTGIVGVIVPDSRFCTTPTGTPTVLGPQVGQRLDGSSLPSSPKNKAAFNANYTFFTPAGNLTLSGTWTYRDKAYYSVFSREHYLAPAYDETDLRVLWNEPNDRYTLIAFCKNVFDDEGFEAAAASMSAWGVQSRSRAFTFPRTYGIEAQFRFGN